MKPYGADPWVDCRMKPRARAAETRRAMEHEKAADDVFLHEGWFLTQVYSQRLCPVCSDHMGGEGFVADCGERHCGCHPSSCELCDATVEYAK